MKQYFKIRDNLSIDGGLILFDDRIVVPKMIRNKILIRIHAGHANVKRTVESAVELVYWPNIRKDFRRKMQNLSEI